MKIVDRKTFLARPVNTLFSKYQPCAFGDLMIKGDNCGDNDFHSQAIADAIRYNDSEDFIVKLEEARVTGCSLDMDFRSEGRDGMFDDAQLFAVWEAADVRDLLGRLKFVYRMACLKEGFCSCEEPSHRVGICVNCYKTVMQL